MTCMYMANKQNKINKIFNLQIITIVYKTTLFGYEELLRRESEASEGRKKWGSRFMIYKPSQGREN